MHGSSESGGNSSAQTATSAHEHPPPEKLIVYVVLPLLAVSIMGANVLVVYLVRAKAFLKTATNACLVSLAVSDFLAGAVAIPMLLACNLTFNGRVCIAMDLCARFIAIATVLHLLVVALERYLMIVHAMSYSRWVTKPRVIGGLVALWLFSLTLCLVQLGWSEQSRTNDVIYDLVVLLSVLLPSFLLMAFAFCQIFATLRKQLKQRNQLQLPSVRVSLQRRNNKPAKERKAVLIFGSLTLSFIVCWFTYFLEGLRTDLNLEALQMPLWAQCFFAVLRFCTSLINPLVYTLFKKDFRKALRLIARRKRTMRESKVRLLRSAHVKSSQAWLDYFSQRGGDARNKSLQQGLLRSCW